MPLRAVLLDAGGTLFHLRGSVGEAYATVAADHGVQIGPDVVEARFAQAFRAMPPLAFPGTPEGKLQAREHAWWRRLVRTTLAGQHFDDFEVFFWALFDYFARPDSWQLFPDAIPALASLRRRGCALGVVSNFDARLVALCTGLGISDLLDTIVMSARSGYAKPDPRIFAIALQRLGVTADVAVHVGDSQREDIAGARAAGIRALLVARDEPPDPGAGRISSLQHVLALL